MAARAAVAKEVLDSPERWVLNRDVPQQHVGAADERQDVRWAQLLLLLPKEDVGRTMSADSALRLAPVGRRPREPSVPIDRAVAALDRDVCGVDS